MASQQTSHSFSEKDDSVAVLQAAFVTQDSDTACLPQPGTASAHPSSTASSGLSIEFASTPGSSDGRLDTMVSACRTILECLGEDPSREGLQKTPIRMAKALIACTAGYSEDAKTLIKDALFSCTSEEIVLVRDIDCFSMCEHHMLPFFGKVHIAYIPNGKVLGLSKFARITDMFAKRLQMQEQLTTQIAEALQEHVGAKGVAVMSNMTHMCMSMRGVEKPGATTVSTAFTGAFKDDPVQRAQFFELLKASQTAS